MIKIIKTNYLNIIKKSIDIQKYYQLYCIIQNLKYKIFSILEKKRNFLYRKNKDDFLIANLI